MKHDLTTGTWQDDTGCPISIILATTSDVGTAVGSTLARHQTPPPVLVNHHQTASRKRHNNKQLGLKEPSQTKYCITSILDYGSAPLMHNWSRQVSTGRHMRSKWHVWNMAHASSNNLQHRAFVIVHNLSCQAKPDSTIKTPTIKPSQRTWFPQTGVLHQMHNSVLVHLISSWCI